MTIKKSYPALESALFLRGESKQIALNLGSKDKEKVMRKLESLPKEIVVEMEKFVERNSLAVVGACLVDGMPLHKCCRECLKAHTLLKAREMCLEQEKMELLNEAFAECGIGHEGFYINNGELVKIYSG